MPSNEIFRTGAIKICGVIYSIKKTDAQFSSDSRSQIPSESETVGTHTAETGAEGTAEWNEQRRRTPPQQATSSHLKLETFEKTNKL